MNRPNHPFPSDALMTGRRTAAMARCVAGCLVVGCFLAAGALTACQQQPPATRAIERRGGSTRHARNRQKHWRAVATRSE